MRLSILALLAPALFVLATPAAGAQVAPYVGYNTQHETPLVGAAYVAPITDAVALNPSVEVGVGGNEGYVQASADVTVSAGAGTFAPYVGAGVTAGRMPMNGDTKWHAGANALVGARIEGLGGFVPFAQLRYTVVGGGDAGSLMAGAAFRF